MHSLKAHFKTLPKSIAAIALGLSATFAQADNSCDLPQNPHMTFDINTGKKILGYAADTIIQPGSMAKMMTELVIFEARRDGIINDKNKVRISADTMRKARKSGGKTCGINRLPFDSAVQLIALRSCGDITIGLAKDVALQHAPKVANKDLEREFIKLMNKKAKEIGMQKTYFDNSTGLPSKHSKTNLSDIAKLLKHINDEWPELKKVLGQHVYDQNGIYRQNTITLMRNARFDDKDIFGKTAYIDAIKHSWALSIDDNGQNIGIISICNKNSKMREQETIKLYEKSKGILENNPEHAHGDNIIEQKEDLTIQFDLHPAHHTIFEQPKNVPSEYYPHQG